MAKKTETAAPKLADTVTGTISELAEQIMVNGHHVGSAELSVITRLGLGSYAKIANMIQPMKDGKPARGRPSPVWELNTAAMTLALSPVLAVVASAAPEPAAEPVAQSEPAAA